MKNAQKMTQNHLDLSQILADSAPFESQSCLYYLIDEDDEVVYVGQTQNLYAQLLHHQLAGQQFARFSCFPGSEEELDQLEQEALSRFRPVHNKIAYPKPIDRKPVAAQSMSSYLTKSLICLKHNITAVAFERLRQEFGLEPVSRFGATKYYRQEDVDSWLKRFKGLVVRGRYVLQARPSYLAVGVSERTKQIQLYTKR